jgi:hypothetical protein
VALLNFNLNKTVKTASNDIYVFSQSRRVAYLKSNDRCLTQSRSPGPLTLVAIPSREVRCWSVTRRVNEDCAYVNGYKFLVAGFYHAEDWDKNSNILSGEEDQL